MHELSIAQNIISIIQDYINEDQKNTVKTIRLKIGKLSNVLTDSLLFGFEVLTKDTYLEGANLEIEHLPVRIHCEACGEETTIEDFLFLCSVCHSSKVKVLSGYELMVSEIELTD